MTGGTDRASQATAGFALMEVVNTAVAHNDKEFLEEIRRRYIQGFLVRMSEECGLNGLCDLEN